jgi:hypothetical protein
MAARRHVEQVRFAEPAHSMHGLHALRQSSEATIAPAARRAAGILGTPRIFIREGRAWEARHSYDRNSGQYR